MRVARCLGVFLRGLLLGLLIFAAALQLASIRTDARIFEYQGY